MSGLWAGFWATDDSAAILDVVLMAALADGELGPEAQDRLGRIIQQTPSLCETDWDLVIERANALSLEAPLFSETRQGLSQRLVDPDARRLALGLALQAQGDPPSDESRAVVADIARGLDIDEPTVRDLAQAVRPGGLRRCGLNDPRNVQRATLFTALEGARDDPQRGLILHKIDGVRRLLWALDGDASIVSFAERLRFDDLVFRVDVILEHALRRRLVRILAPGEALYQEEHPLLRQLAERLPDGASLVVAHFGALGPADRSFLQSFDPERLETIRL